MQQSETKEHIIAKVFKLLLQKGYDGVSITDIQKETGMARGLLYHYFGSKEQLFVEVTTKYFLVMFNIDMEKIKNYNVEQMIAYTIEMYGAILIKELDGFTKQGVAVSMVDYDFLFYRVMQENKIFAQKYDQFREHEQIAWRMVLGNARAQGVLRDDISLEKSAVYFSYLMDGVWMNMIHCNSPQVLLTNLQSTLVDYYQLLRRF